VEVEITSTGKWLYAEYDRMTVASETDKYRLQVSGYHGNASDAFNDNNNDEWRSNEMPFSTPDRDNDEWDAGSCANDRWSSGWWFRACSSSCLNGVSERYGYPGVHVMRWYSTPSSPNLEARNVSTSRMMLKC